MPRNSKSAQPDYYNLVCNLQSSISLTCFESDNLIIIDTRYKDLPLCIL